MVTDVLIEIVTTLELSGPAQEALAAALGVAGDLESLLARAAQRFSAAVREALLAEAARLGVSPADLGLSNSGRSATQHNEIRDAIEAQKSEGLTPEAALLYALICLRGGRAAEAVIDADQQEWTAEHGQPTWEVLATWADGLGIEAEIASAMLRVRRRQRDTT